MARIRSVKPELRTSGVVASWPWPVRYFWVLLWGYLDDKGRGYDNEKSIAGDCFPLDPQVTHRVIHKWLDLLSTSHTPGKEPPLCRYEVDGRRYLHAVHWGDNQRINRPTPSRLPPCPRHELTEPLTEPLNGHSMSPLTEPLTEPLTGGKGKGKGNRRGEGDSLSDTPPTATPTPPNPGSPPPRQCSTHIDDPDPPACRRCADARRARADWDAAQLAATNPGPGRDTRPVPTTAQCPRHRGQPAANSAACRSERLAANDDGPKP